MKSRRLKAFLVGPHFFADLAMAGSVHAPLRCVEGIPPGAHVEGAGFDLEANAFCIVVAHDDFDEVPEGKPVPRVAPTFEEIESWPIQELGNGLQPEG